MTELNSIKAGDRVLVKIGRNLIECEALAVGPDGVTVRSLSTGREFTTARVEEVVGRAEPPAAEVTAAEATAQNPPADEKPEMEAAAGEKPEAEKPAEAPAPRQPEAEAPAPEEQVAEGPVGADGPKPRRKLSLLNAAIEVLRAEGRPLNTRDLVKLAMERGLWTPTGCRTPEQSLYGAIFLEIKNSDNPRVRKSAERGKFELA